MEFDRPSAFRPRGAQLTPLIDIVFLLVIFFMLTSHFVRNKVIDINLPRADGQAIDEVPERITLTIDENGHILTDEGPLPLQELPSWFREQQVSHRDPASTPIILRTDRRAPFGFAVKVIAQARQAGFVMIDVMTRSP